MSLAHQESRAPFEREPSGLISLEQYKDYLIDAPSKVPLFFPDNNKNRSPRRFVYQHLLFQASSYWQLHLPAKERDRRYRAIRELSYSQIAMRSFMEDRLHSDMEIDVAYPPEPTVDGALLDYFDLDLAAASALGIEDIKHPRPINPDDIKLFRSKPVELQPLTQEDKVGIYETMLEAAIRRLESPRVLPEDVVTSALMRLARLVRHNDFSQIAQERLQGDHYYPLRVPKAGTLRNIGSGVIRESVGLTSIGALQNEMQSLRPPLHIVGVQAA